MIFKYSIIGIEDKPTTSLISQLSDSKIFEPAGNSKDPQKLLDIILANTPNLIFINVDDYSTYDFLTLTSTINDLYRSHPQKPYLVAIASTDKEAYDCIKNSFFDYLLRPFDGLQMQKLNYKLRALAPVMNVPKTLCLQTYSDYRFIEIKDILYLKSDNNTTEFFMLDETKILAFRTLKHFELVLPKSFKRIHQSFIINQEYISRIHLGRFECQLKPLRMRLPFSKSYRSVMAKLAISLSQNALS